MPASNFLPDSFIKVILTFITTFGILTTNVFANQDSIIWLETQSNQDGSYSSLADIATPYQSTAEVLRTLTILSPATNTDPGLQYLAVESYHSTENLSRKILALSDVGQDSAQLVTELSGMQNFDGGWGELYGYHSSAIDTQHLHSVFWQT